MDRRLICVYRWLASGAAVTLANAIRFSTLEAICDALSCQPGDLLRSELEHLEPEPVAVRKGSASR